MSKSNPEPTSRAIDMPRFATLSTLARVVLPSLGALAGAGAWAQSAAPAALPQADSQLTWQQCQAIAGNDKARLACFDRWSQQQSLPAAAVPPAPAALTGAPASADAAPTEPPVDSSVPVTRVVEAPSGRGCRNREYSTLSRFWELEPDSSCGIFGLRGYKPTDLTVALSPEKPQAPTSPAPNHNGTQQDYQNAEMQINLSLRSKLAQGLLTRNDPARQDSLWFGYTQQSNWQLFNNDLSRPFRNTDYQPEMMYVYPTDVHLPGGWRWRYAGVGLVHQSNGQSEPLSRSWNRYYLMGGIELGNSFAVTARVWKRISESATDDDNPDITDYLGHGEISGWWYPDSRNAFGLTLGGFGTASQKLEYTRVIGDPGSSDLRFLVQLFNGYGNTLLDYNRNRTVLNIGLRLVDF
ncbi:phospholipase A [Variovorax dokdonensis]|uniref:Phospholipase A1 n=1 Tax=Variovorax dokdonensis TaxID=344883 RepID=A0ABT7NGL2_9BURK|nr:phospholipase A [Variovorax dokdonensis]MDM0047061.1 phospholipase A [Variovorax dokdonensis]